jgi:membrane protein DedA with SNARE-associated domain/membrane-associated phospholipid phosphatase
MSVWVDSSIALISTHPHWAGLFVFLVAASEAIVLAGYIIPGTVILLGVGGIVGMGHLPLLPILLWAATGAVAGDGISYWLGHHYKEALRARWPFSRYPDLIDRGESFFHRHGGKSVVIGRFLPVLKPIIPTVAGILGMPPLRFYTVNVLSALLWSPVHILPGVLAGASLQLLHGVSPRLAVAALVLILALLLALWSTRMLVLRTAPLLWHVLDHAYAWSQRQPGTWLQRLAVRFDPNRPATSALLATLAMLMLAFIGFVAVLEDVLTQDALVRADHAINTLLQSLRNPWTDPFMITVSGLGDTLVSGGVALAMIGWLLLVKRWRLALAVTAGLVLTAAGIPLMKLLIQVPRPHEMYAGFEAFSFPSGHTTMAAAIYGSAAWMLAGGVRLRWRPLVYALAFFWMLLMATSRVYLGAHWPSDVLAGLCLGLLAPATVATLYPSYLRRRLHSVLMALMLLGVVATVGTWHVTHNWDKSVARYLPEKSLEPLDVSAWETGAGPVIAAQRIDLAGEEEEPLSLQWLGTSQALAGRLQTLGWSTPPAWDLATAMGYLRPDTLIDQLPVLPALHNGQVPVLTLVRKPASSLDQRWVLRAWRSSYQDVRQHTPLLLASVVREQTLHPARLLTLVKSRPASSSETKRLLEPAIQPLISSPITLHGEHWKGVFAILRAINDSHMKPKKRE